MQITDAQFIRAMEQAVKEKGSGHVAQATYWMGAPACIVGYALGTINSAYCPKDNQEMADRLLVKAGCSEKVAFAAYAAQHLNDSGYSWGDVLAGFHYGMTIPEGFASFEVVYRVRMHAERSRSERRSRDAAKTGTNVQSFMDLVTMPKPEPVQWIQKPGQKITVSFSMSGGFSSLSASLSTTIAEIEALTKVLDQANAKAVAEQKDHALVA